MAGALEMAGEIAGRSPVAVQGTKINLLYARDHSVAEALDYIVRTDTSKKDCKGKQSVSAVVKRRFHLVPSSPGDVEHEHASDSRCDEISSSVHGEEESKDSGLLQTLKLIQFFFFFYFSTVAFVYKQKANEDFPKICALLTQQFDKDTVTVELCANCGIKDIMNVIKETHLQVSIDLRFFFFINCNKLGFCKTQVKTGKFK